MAKDLLERELRLLLCGGGDGGGKERRGRGRRRRGFLGCFLGRQRGRRREGKGTTAAQRGEGEGIWQVVAGDEGEGREREGCCGALELGEGRERRDPLDQKEWTARIDYRINGSGRGYIHLSR
ncbi:hypothetical protein HAX54_037525, partial [Datura stramonium]|nr:hypothetical protein [Datura stramonium]